MARQSRKSRKLTGGSAECERSVELRCRTRIPRYTWRSDTSRELSKVRTRVGSSVELGPEQEAQGGAPAEQIAPAEQWTGKALRRQSAMQ